MFYLKKYSSILTTKNIKYFSILSFDKIFNVLFLLITAKLLKPNEYGTYSQETTASSIFSNLSLFGLSTPFIIYYFEYNLDKSIAILKINYLFRISFLIFIFISLLFFIFNNYFSNLIFSELKNDLLVILIIMLSSDILSEYIILYKRLIQDKIFLSKYIFKKNIFKFSIFLFFLFISKSFITSLYVSVLTSLFLNLYIYYKIIDSNFSFYKIGDKIFYIECLLFLSFYILSNITLYTINIYLVKFYDLKMLGIYAFNNSISSLPIFFVTVIGYFLFPSFSNFMKENNFSKAKKLLLIASFLFIIFFLISQLLIYLFFNFLNFSILNNNLFSNKMFFILCFSNLFFGLNAIIQYPLIYKKEFKILFFGIILCTIINFFIIIYFNKILHEYTPVFSFLISTFFILLYNIFYFNKIFKKNSNIVIQ